ncbi:glycoside hydrolase family 16 protein [Amniculicola lignicola CBS 123094]|uniref:endo-1,3(4)-beta-glucanase n=1 Tax=Amniculicola lignicola CBS 123094 TaxID=1392246 RepID=A0A6A5VW95_9PLEO|nr:glycoside hydrolase family 16 protein [Amniculicola lignicola CBS 123094]
MHFSTLFSGAALFQICIAGYVLEDDYMQDFFGGFEFFTAPDPTNGFVQYVDQATAQNTGLINSTTTGSVSWGVDTTNKTPEGRPSVRITSKKAYNNGLVILDVEHMPVGCGTWPAFWMVGPNWPNGGEIDILEGVNDQEQNAMTLHTAPGCSIGDATEGAFTGSVTTSNCDVDAEGQDKNAGCSIKHPSKQSYGSGLNDINGGVYATLWTDEAISVYFFPRGDIPLDALGDSPDPSGWGTPAAKFAGACDIPKTFKDNQIVFDTTFCGDWAGNAWSSSSCASKASTCNTYVRDNPQAFTEAFWTVKSLKVYQDNGQAPVSSSTPTISSSLAISAPSATASPAPASSSVFVPFPELSTTQILVPDTTTIIISSTIPPFPTGNGTIPTFPTGVPAPVETSDSLSTPLSQIAAPTGGDGGPMPGFTWPGGAGTSRAASVRSSRVARSNAISTAAVPTTILTVPSASPATTTPAPFPTNRLPDKAVATVIQTVYVTVPVAGQKRARQMREHRRKWTQHNARR